jgi:PAS domain S-box-containing protein
VIVSSEPMHTVLIVEDDPGVMRLQQLRLERAGYACKSAATAAEALGLVRQGEIDLMLLDQNLPGGVNGLELYAQIKEMGYDIPAILVTGFTGDTIVLQSFRAGLYDFVPKTPDYMDYLLPTIERVLKKRRTESMLVESEARLGSIIRSTIDAVLTVDETQQIGIFNPAAEQMFGLTAEDIHSRPVQQLIPAWDTSPGNARGRDEDGPLPGEKIQRWETEGVRADGTRFPVELSVAWVEANRRRFWTCVARDVSERKKAQEQRENLIREQAARKEAEAARERLEAVIEENTRLYRELQQVDKLKDQFLAMLAHELRNPLAPIRNALELIQLEDPPPPPGVRDNLEIIDRQVTHLVRLVGDLLDVSRISQGKIVLRKEPLDLATVVTRGLETSQPVIAGRRHSLRVSLPQEPLPVEGDLVRLVQVLANLLNNAAKYTREGGRIELLVEKAGGEAVMRVRDNGMGIPKEMQPRLFDLFTQSDRTLDRSEGGLGIGLTLVRRLTEMHGGTVEAHSEGQGHGSEFVVRLPLAESRPEGPAPAPPPPAAAGRRRRVLAVDDNRDSARTLTRLLQVLGHEVSTAHDGPAALAEADRFHPEIVLLDIGLPGMDGFEVARRLRASPAFADTVLIALTGYGSPEDRAASREAGFNAHLVKPVDLEALKELLARPLELLRHRRGD